jgi:hypothetical protein
MHSTPLITTVMVGLLLGVTSLADESWTLKASDKVLKVTGKLLDPLNVSGIASIRDGQIILACDELHHGVQAGHLDLKKGEISMDPAEFTLLADNKKELDLESAAADPDHHRYYTCGSCSVSRKKGKESPDRQWLFRMETDAKTGALLPGKVAKVSLRDAMKADAFLNEHIDKSADELGIDVEGLAFKEGRLWFGLRSPNVNGWGFVVAASADDLLAKKAVRFDRLELPLGEDLGIRDLAPVKGGFLLIAGPTDARDKQAAEPAEPSKKVKSEPKATPAPVETVAKATPAAAPKADAAKAPAKEAVAKASPAVKPAPQPKTEAAPAKEPKATFTLFFWPGDASRPTRIGELQRPAGGDGGKGSLGKPEGLLVVNETAEKMDIIVLSDGSTNGAPALYEVTRKGGVAGPINR